MLAGWLILDSEPIPHPVFLIAKTEEAEAYSEPCQTSKMEIFVKVVNGVEMESFTIKVDSF